MKKRVIILFVGLIFLINIFGVISIDSNSNNSCVDTDGGRNYYEFGTVINQDMNFTDYCSLSRDGTGSVNDCSGLNCTISEKLCNENGQSGEIDYPCPTGCIKGACIRTNLKCQEFSRGVINYDGSLTYNLCTVYGHDQIKGLRIYSCKNDTKIFTVYSCPNGCNDANCIGNNIGPVISSSEIDAKNNADEQRSMFWSSIITRIFFNCCNYYSNKCNNSCFMVFSKKKKI